MKKRIAILLCIILILPLMACSAGEKTAEQRAEEIIKSMTLEEKVWQMIFAAPEDIIDSNPVVAAGDKTKQAIGEHPVGGIVYFSQNIESREQLADMISGVQTYSQIPLFIAVDEEGGRVARLGNADIGAEKLPPMAEIGSGGDAERARDIGEKLGVELTALGFNVDFAPVADVLTVGDNEEIGDRSFGSDASLVADMIRAEVSGMSGKNLCSTLKHFPGSGSADGNTHYGAALTNRTLDEMRAAEFVPFKAGIDEGADFVMVSHMAAPDITGDETPCSMSEAVITDILRNELDFGGIVITDALNMGAITSQYTPEEAAIAAVDAGTDMLLMSPDVSAAVSALVNAVGNGEIPEERINESVRRILKVKLSRGIIR